MSEIMLYVAIGIAGGIVLTLLAIFVRSKFLKIVLKNTQLIKNYWIFVIIFSTFFITLYLFLLLVNIDQTLRQNLLSFANQVTAIIFAIFTGYFAFSQVMESRFEKLKKDGLDFLRGKYYTESEQAWESALAIKKNDYRVLSNLLEVYALEGKYEKVDSQLENLRKLITPERKEVPSIIQAMTRIFQGRLNEARDSIADTIRIIDEKNDISYLQRWTFEDAKQSRTYLKLTGEAKTLIEKFDRYIEGLMPENERTAYESSNDYL